MKRHYRQVCVNCGHDADKHGSEHCLHNVGDSTVNVYGRSNDDAVACGCERWFGVLVLDWEEDQ